MPEKELKLSVLAKVGLFILVVLTSALTFYMTSRYTATFLSQSGLSQSNVNSSTFLTFALIGGIVGAIIAFLVTWGIGTLVLMVANTRQYQNALYLALAIKYSVVNIFMATFLMFSNKIMSYSWATSILEFIIFFGCYYVLTNKNMKSSLQVTGVYVIIFVIGQVIALAF